MKTIWITLLCLMIFQITNAQETHSRNFAIKNYVSFGLEKGDVNFRNIYSWNSSWTRDSVDQIDIKIIRPAFNLFTKKGHLHELEITALKWLNDFHQTNYTYNNGNASFSGDFGEYQRNTRDFGLRYQFSMLIRKRKSKWYLGLGADGFINKVSNTPRIEPASNRIKTFDRTLGTTVHLVPRFHHPINDKVFIDVHSVIHIYKYTENFHQRSLPGNLELVSDYTYTFSDILPVNFEIAIGIGYKFENNK